MIILSFPLQFSFHLNFYTHGASDIQSNWDFNHVSPTLLDVSNRITNYFGAVSSIAFIFINYKIKKRRLLISAIYIISGIAWLIFIAINDANIWLSIILRAFDGIFIGFFQSSHISYLMRFSQDRMSGFHSSLIEVVITFGITILNLMFYSMSWKIVAVILSVQSFLFGGLIWLIPEYTVISKAYSRQYIHKSPYLKHCLVMVAIMAIQCFSGIGFMIDNCSRLLGDIGVDLDPYVELCLVNLISCISALIGSFIIDIVGVPSMWAFSAFGITLSLIIYDITLKVTCPKWFGVFGVFLYFLFFGLGEGTIPWMLCGLLFPESIMIESGGINTFVNQFMGIWFGYLQNEIIKKCGEFTSVLFSAIISFFGIWFGFYLIPKKKKSQEENITVF